MNPQYDHPTAFSLWDEREWEAMDRVVRSGRFTMGEEVEAFEEEFAAAHYRKHAIMVNSGSSANLVATAALFNKRENPLRGPRHVAETYRHEAGHGVATYPQETAPDRAIVPAIAWSTTYAPLVQHGLELALADVDETWNAPTPAMVIGDHRLIVIASILGNPSYGAEWSALAKAAGAYVLEDNCESFWADAPEGRKCGTFGTLSTFSFFYSHQISAIEGGMILTDDEELANLCRILRAHGWTRDVWHSPTGERAAPPRFEQEYEFTHFGYNVRPLELHAAIAREQLKKRDEFRRARCWNMLTFSKMVCDLAVPVQLPMWHGTLNPFGLHFLCPTAQARASLVAEFRICGIDCRLPTGGSFRRHPYGARWRNQETPMADSIHDRGLFLGNAPFDITDKIERAVKVMADALAKVPA